MRIKPPNLRSLLGRCDGLTRDGTPCTRGSGTDGRCWQHPRATRIDSSDLPFCLSDEELMAEEAAERRRAERRRK